MQAICKTTGKSFTISDREANYCKERGMQLPKQQPLERWRQIASFRNRINLFNTTCALTGRPILSCVPPDRGFTVYDLAAWSGDNWNPLVYGQEYDPNRPFFEQFNELLHKVPLPNLNVVTGTMENSDYVNGAMNLKNCYLCFSTLNSSDLMFTWAVFDSHNVLDSINCYSCEICYGCRDAEKCYNCVFVESCHTCSDSAFMFNCQSCKNCFGCVNLNNKEYCWYNEQLTKEEFEMRNAKFEMGSRREVEKEKARFAEFKKNFPIKYYQGKNIENSTGNYLNGTKDSRNIFYSSNCIDAEDCWLLIGGKDCFDVLSSSKCELCYAVQSGINYNCQYCNESIANNRNLQWCMYTNTSSDCFGCISLKKSQYCILNKQYSKEEYEKLTKEIKHKMIASGEYEDFFPRRLSPFHYNESDAMLWFPLSKEEALTKGFTWKDEVPETHDNTALAPDNILDVTDNILQQTFSCSQTGKKYRITKQELDFYRRLNLPVPNIAPLTRIANMAASFFNTHELHLGQCAQCQKSFETAYDTTKQKVLCEECYLQTTF
ncbi:MAG: hypothetical protein HY817_00050 [Candidatus Abawacabacteria bacterium]|nr:hypothetical protein [Candidatus Abawacabacteria bacterium]